MHMPPPEQAPDAAGLVIVDIGGDMGALVISTPSELAGEETTAAVFGSLRAGRYELRIKGAAGTEHPGPVVVEGAQVTQVTWAGTAS